MEAVLSLASEMPHRALDEVRVHGSLRGCLKSFIVNYNIKVIYINIVIINELVQTRHPIV